MPKFMVIRLAPFSKPDRVQDGKSKKAFSMLTAEGVYQDGTNQFVCTLPPWFEFRDDKGNITQPFPDVKVGQTYELSPRWSAERGGVKKGELRFDIELRAISAVKAA